MPHASLGLEHKGGEKKNVKTNEDGYYEVLFHLHNDNLGDEIIIKYGEKTKTHKVQFDPEDSVSHRGADIDFGAPGKEGAKLWIFLTIIFLVGMGVGVYFVLFKKNTPIKEESGGIRKKRKKKKRK